jgi:hypothetical protein
MCENDFFDTQSIEEKIAAHLTAVAHPLGLELEERFNRADHWNLEYLTRAQTAQGRLAQAREHYDARDYRALLDSLRAVVRDTRELEKLGQALKKKD